MAQDRRQPGWLKTEPLLSQYPKARCELPPAYAHIYEQQYLDNRGGATRASGLAQRLEAWMHRQVALDLPGLRSIDYSTLEIGAGNLNHLRYEDLGKIYDIVEPFSKLYLGKNGLNRIRTVYQDVSEVPLADRYDRIISVATFEHILDLPVLVARCGLLLARHGTLRVAISSEGTLLWRLGWRLTTGLEFKLRHGLDYGVIMRHEHVNTADEVERVLRFFFQKVKLKVFGVSRYFSLYRFCECEKAYIDRCNDYFRQ